MSTPPVPPPERGAFLLPLWLVGRLRFIPANVRNTAVLGPKPLAAAVHPRERGEHRSAGRRCGGCSVHPRERGEHPNDGSQWNGLDGSFPSARRTHHMARHVLVRGRFIPASAGNTAGRAYAAVAAAVHPRERGEHSSTVIPTWPQPGSSPRARGRPAQCGGETADSRLIPASAGNTPARGPRSVPYAVHPRERGEHGCSTKMESEGVG